MYNFYLKYKYLKKRAAKIDELDYLIPEFRNNQPFQALRYSGQICYFH